MQSEESRRSNSCRPAYFVDSHENTSDQSSNKCEPYPPEKSDRFRAEPDPFEAPCAVEPQDDEFPVGKEDGYSAEERQRGHRHVGTVA